MLLLLITWCHYTCCYYTLKQLSVELIQYSVPTSDIELAAEVVITAKYFDYDLLWTLIGVGGIVLVISCICCVAIRDICHYCRLRGWRLIRWSPRKLPQRKYKKGKELYETCVICQEDVFTIYKEYRKELYSYRSNQIYFYTKPGIKEFPFWKINIF